MIDAASRSDVGSVFMHLYKLSDLVTDIAIVAERVKTVAEHRRIACVSQVREWTVMCGARRRYRPIAKPLLACSQAALPYRISTTSQAVLVTRITNTALVSQSSSLYFYPSLSVSLSLCVSVRLSLCMPS